MSSSVPSRKLSGGGGSGVSRLFDYFVIIGLDENSGLEVLQSYEADPPSELSVIGIIIYNSPQVPSELRSKPRSVAFQTVSMFFYTKGKDRN